jgi:hypothetical protein
MIDMSGLSRGDELDVETLTVQPREPVGNRSTFNQQFLKTSAVLKVCAVGPDELEQTRSKQREARDHPARPGRWIRPAPGGRAPIRRR